jgi:hypothetical protein
MPELGESALDAAIGEAFAADDSPAPELPAETAQAAPAPEASEDEWDAIPSHEELSNGVKRINRIPHDRVGKIVEKQRAKAVEETLAQLRETLGLPADAPLTLEDARKHVGERSTKLTAAEQELQAMQQALEMDPERFLQLASQRNPAYQRFLQPQAPPPAPVADLNIDDYSVDLGDGKRTFSFEGLQKYIDQVVSKATTPLQPLVTRAQQEADLQKRREQVAPFVQFAQSLPGFKEHEAEILKAITEDKTLTLPQAYERVVWNKRVTDENAIRERIMQELKAAPPASTSTSSTPAAAGKPPGVDDVIGAALDKASAA